MHSHDDWDKIRPMAMDTFKGSLSTGRSLSPGRDVTLGLPAAGTTTQTVITRMEQAVVTSSDADTHPLREEIRRRTEQALAEILQTQQTLLARTAKMDWALSLLVRSLPAQIDGLTQMGNALKESGHSKPRDSPRRSNTPKKVEMCEGGESDPLVSACSFASDSSFVRAASSQPDVAINIPSEYPLNPSVGIKASPRTHMAYKDLISTPAYKDAAFAAVTDGDPETVQDLLKKGLDPNTELQNTTLLGRQYTQCSLLAAAVAVSDHKMAHLLMKAGAYPDSKYGFLAGATHMKWSGTAAFIAAHKGDLRMLKNLLKWRADHHAVSSNNANLVWQAAYANQPRTLRYLLDLRVSLDIAAASQNHRTATQRPLHAAVLAGSLQGVQILLQYKADASVTDASLQNEQKAPLDDAIRYNHPKMLGLLVASRADIHNSKDTSWLQQLYRCENPILYQAVAHSLHQDSVKQMSVDDVLEFLSKDVSTLKAFFCQRKFRYRGPMKGMRVLKTALLAYSDGRTMSESSYPIFPHIVESSFSFYDVEAAYRSWQEPSPEMMNFMNDLAPSDQSATSFKARYVSVSIHQCLIPDVHNNLRVKELLAETDKTNPIWLDTNCQAIFRHAWSNDWWMAILDVVCNSLFVVVLLVTGYLMGYHEQNTKFISSNIVSVQCVAACGIPFFLYELCAESFQMIYFFSEAGRGWDYCRDPANIFDACRIIADGLVLWQLLAWDGYGGWEDTFAFRVWFGSCCFFKWTKLVYSLSQFRKFGYQVLPVLHAMQEIKSFLLILLFYLAAFGHAMLASDLLKEHASSTIVASINFATMGDPDKVLALHQHHTNPNLHRFSMFMLYTLAGFVFPVTIMNIFIAALCDSYSWGKRNNENLFMHRFAQCVTTAGHVKTIASRVFSRKRNTQVKHLWYCVDNSHVLEWHPKYSGKPRSE